MLTDILNTSNVLRTGIHTEGMWLMINLSSKYNIPIRSFAAFIPSVIHSRYSRDMHVYSVLVQIYSHRTEYKSLRDTVDIGNTTNRDIS